MKLLWYVAEQKMQGGDKVKPLPAAMLCWSCWSVTATGCDDRKSAKWPSDFCLPAARLLEQVLAKWQG